MDSRVSFTDQVEFNPPPQVKGYATSEFRLPSFDHLVLGNGSIVSQIEPQTHDTFLLKKIVNDQPTEIKTKVDKYDNAGVQVCSEFV
jgi:hypothetical protein